MFYKLYAIRDGVRGEIVRAVVSNNGKNAIRKFSRCLTATGIYEIVKHGGNFALVSSYGSLFIAEEVASFTGMQKMTDEEVMQEYILHTPAMMREIPENILKGVV